MKTGKQLLWAVAFLAGSNSALAAEYCADAPQTSQVREYYAENPGAQPAVVALRLGLPEAIVLSAMDANRVASVDAALFPQVWDMMTEWKEATFLIMKGNSAFEILSGVGEGKPSTRSSYYNIEYVHPMRGHLRPDEFTAIYAVILPHEEHAKIGRGIIFLNDEGNSVFAAFISGDSMAATDVEIAKFDKLLAMLREQPQVCP